MQLEIRLVMIAAIIQYILSRIMVTRSYRRLCVAKAPCPLGCSRDYYSFEENWYRGWRKIYFMSFNFIYYIMLWFIIKCMISLSVNMSNVIMSTSIQVSNVWIYPHIHRYITPYIPHPIPHHPREPWTMNKRHSNYKLLTSISFQAPMAIPPSTLKQCPVI